MVEKPHEVLRYQEFLVSEIRESLVPKETYLKFLSDEKELPVNYLDFGCGLGYVALLLGEASRDRKNIHIYACDYQEDLLDLLWKKIVQRKLTNITPFYLPDRSLIFFPKWLPLIDHIIFSFSLSCVDDGYKVFQSIKKGLREEAYVHIVDWENHSENQLLKELFPPEYRLTALILQQWLELTGYVVEALESGAHDYFYIRAQLVRPD
ncbi:MAG: class I SAM-dependent methyltransferase [Leptospiraceae bacterium]|nr:class I SAM-dependent methyltransferase [Leptospiraceae bacterium]MDW8307062.1 class I SAM-dependent methyltransferase [Leptospiraceae bacterium]